MGDVALSAVKGLNVIYVMMAKDSNNPTQIFLKKELTQQKQRAKGNNKNKRRQVCGRQRKAW